MAFFEKASQCLKVTVNMAWWLHGGLKGWRLLKTSKLPQPPNTYHDRLCFFPHSPTPCLKCTRRDSRKLSWRCTSVCMCEPRRVGVELRGEGFLKWWKYVFLHLFCRQAGNLIPTPLISWPPLPSFHDPHAALKIRLQTQTWVTDNPDCGLLNSTILQTLKLNSTREEKTRWLCSAWFCVCGLPVNRDLGFEGKPWQLLAAAAETGECVTYRSVLSLNCCITSKWLRPQKVLMDIDGSHKHKTPPPINQLKVELLYFQYECRVMWA